MRSTLPGDTRFDPINEPQSVSTTEAPGLERPRASLFRYSPALLLVIIAVADAGRFADPDLWGHLYFGTYVIRTGRFMMRDQFSFTAFGMPWLDHERLAEVALAFSYLAGGIVGLKLFKFLWTAVTFVLISFAQAETGAPPLVQAAVLMGIAIGLGPEIQFRPQIFTFAAFAGLLLILTRFTYDRRKHLWPIVPLMLIWANLHGGYVAGLFAIAVFGVVSTIIDVLDGRGLSTNAVRVGAVFVLSVAVTFVTPFDFDNWRAVLRTFANPMTHHLIKEWFPLTTVMISRVRESPSAAILYAIIIAVMVGTVVTFVIAPSRTDAPLFAIAAVTIIAGFDAIRNIEVALIASAVPLASSLNRISERRGHRGNRYGHSLSAGRWRINQAIVAALAVFVMVRTGLFSSHLGTGIEYPNGAIAFMERNHLRGNVMNDFDWGQYIIYHLAPGSKVFIDGRYDLVYPPPIVKDYLRFDNDEPGAGQVLNEYPIDWVLISPAGRASRVVTSSNRWTLVYRDQKSALYGRKSLTASLGEIPVSAVAAPSNFP